MSLSSPTSPWGGGIQAQQKEGWFWRLTSKDRLRNSPSGDWSVEGYVVFGLWFGYFCYPGKWLNFMWLSWKANPWKTWQEAGGQQEALETMSPCSIAPWHKLALQMVGILSYRRHIFASLHLTFLYLSDSSVPAAYFPPLAHEPLYLPALNLSE